MAKAPTAPARSMGDVNAIIVSERARIATILESPQAKGRTNAAIRLALKSNMDAVSAIELLGDIPAELSPYAEAMQREVGSTAIIAGGGSVQMDARSARLAEIKGATDHYNALNGRKSKKKAE